MQTLALQITVVLILALLVCFVWVLKNAQRKAPLDEVTPPAYRLRGKLFWVIAVAGVVITFATLSPWPHDAQATQVTRHIDVKARQWAWDLSDTHAHVGEMIEFRVTSEDVNHGFALYDSNKKIVAQIQAMPGFVNKVRYHFERAGKYEILCLEYCGVAHHGMVAEIDVQAASAN